MDVRSRMKRESGSSPPKEVSSKDKNKSPRAGLKKNSTSFQALGELDVQHHDSEVQLEVVEVEGLELTSALKPKAEREECFVLGGGDFEEEENVSSVGNGADDDDDDDEGNFF